MSRKTNDSSSTPTTPSVCSACPKAVSSSNETQTPQIDNNDILANIVTQNLMQVETLKTEVEQIKIAQEKQADFYRSGAKLNNVARIAIIILLVIPTLQLIACTAVVYYLGVQEKLNGLLSWVLSGVSLFSIVDIIIVSVKFFSVEKKVDFLENKVDKLSE